MPWANWLGAQLQEMEEEELSVQYSTCGQTYLKGTLSERGAAAMWSFAARTTGLSTARLLRTPTTDACGTLALQIRRLRRTAPHH
jgi:hypothetical protein